MGGNVCAIVVWVKTRRPLTHSKRLRVYLNFARRIQIVSRRQLLESCVVSFGVTVGVCTAHVIQRGPFCTAHKCAIGCTDHLRPALLVWTIFHLAILWSCFCSMQSLSSSGID